MEGKRAIGEPLSLALDAVRALAALVVVLGHCHSIGLYQGPWPFPWMMQHVAVIVFFVLSGLVIADSAQPGQTTLAKFAGARLARLLPVALPAVLLGAAVFLLAHALSGPLARQEPGFDRLTARSLMLPALFLSELPGGEGPTWNSPYWSLCYEFWFYALYGAATFLRGPVRIVCVVAFSFLAGLRVLMLLPVWLAGVVLARRLPGLQLTVGHGLGLIVAGAAIIFALAEDGDGLVRVSHILTGLDPSRLSHSRVWIADWGMAPAVAVMLAGLDPIARRIAPFLARIKRTVRVLSGASFTLYLMHWPVLCLLLALGAVSSNPIILAILLALVQALAILGAALFEQRWTPWLRAALDALAHRGAARLRLA